jgi:hypothetical protein
MPVAEPIDGPVVHKAPASRRRTGRIFDAIAALVFSIRVDGVAATPPTWPTLAQVIQLCDSQTIAEAAATGDQLGWQRVSESDPGFVEWRTNFLRYNGSSVDAVSWRRGKEDNDGQLAFWIARGPDNYRACYYATATPSDLLDALSGRFGSPANLDKYGLATVATWKQGSKEISFSEVGSVATVYIFSR